MVSRDLLVGSVGALCLVFIWSGFIVFSRAGVTGGLTAYDITALRFAVAGLLVLPLLKSWWPRHLPLPVFLVLALFGPGAVYSVIVFLGLTSASAAYAGVFVNASVPILTTLFGYVLTRELPSRRKGIGVAVIVAGGVLLGWRGMQMGGSDVTSGVMLFMAASAVLSVYIVVLHRWQLEPRQVLTLVNLPNALVFLPIWFFFLPSQINAAPTTTIVFQALFQGLGPGFLAVILFSLATTKLGPTPTAAITASVPASAALLAIPVLAEMPTVVEWCGILIVTVGLIVLILRPNN